MVDKIIIFRDGDKNYIPSSLVKYDGLIEINGRLIEKPASQYILSENVLTIRLAERTKVPTSYIYGTHKLSRAKYDERIEYLKKNFKEKIDEAYDEDGDKRNVCIWKDKNAEIEYYNLTNKYTCVYTPVITYSAFIQFDTLDLPRSGSPYIKPDWIVINKFEMTCLFDWKQLMKDVVKELSKKYPELVVKDYVDNYSSQIYINDTNYKLGELHNFSRGTLTECKDAELAITTEIKKYFKLEMGKCSHKRLTDVGSVLNDVDKIINKVTYIQSKIVSRDYKTKAMSMLLELKTKLETEALKDE